MRVVLMQEGQRPDGRLDPSAMRTRWWTRRSSPTRSGSTSTGRASSTSPASSRCVPTPEIATRTSPAARSRSASGRWRRNLLPFNHPIRVGGAGRTRSTCCRTAAQSSASRARTTRTRSRASGSLRPIRRVTATRRSRSSARRSRRSRSSTTGRVYDIPERSLAPSPVQDASPADLPLGDEHGLAPRCRADGHRRDVRQHERGLGVRAGVRRHLPRGASPRPSRSDRR